jgi:uncharacterized membrane protein YqgA involved in biofilm formation
MGTIVNVITVIIGTTIGVILGARFIKKYEEIAIQGIALITVVIGLQMSLKLTTRIRRGSAPLEVLNHII